MDRVDHDALGRADADDALARHRAALRRESDRRFEIDAAHRQRVRRVGLARHAEDEVGRLGQAEPAAFVRGDGGARLALVLEVGKTARTTSVEKISPRPTPMKTSSIEVRASRGSAAFSFASANFLPARSNARSMICRPRPPNWAFAASRVARRMAARARPSRRRRPRRPAANRPRSARSGLRRRYASPRSAARCGR